MKGVIWKSKMENKDDDKLYQYNPNHYCVIYARRSTPNDKDNIINQLNICRNKAKELNLIISNEYSDIESATKYEPMHRPGFKQLMYDIEHNKFKTLIVYKRDRLARKIIHFKEIKSICQSHGIKIVYAANDEIAFDENSITGSLIENILISFSELEPVNINARTSLGLEIKRESGILNITKHPWCYKKVDSNGTAKLVINTDTLPLFTAMFNALSLTDVTKKDIKTICEKLNEDYKDILKSEDINLNPTNVYNLIKNPRIAGYFIKESKTAIEELLVSNEYGKLSIDTSRLIRARNVDKSLLSLEEWLNIVNKFFNNNDINIVAPGAEKSIFTPFLYCQKCKTRVYLVDKQFQCQKKCISLDKQILLEQLTLQIINAIFTEKEILRYYDKNMTDLQDVMDDLEENIQSLTYDQDKILLKMIKNKSVSSSDFNNLSNKKEAIIEKYNTAKASMSQYNYYKNTIIPLVNDKNKFLLLQHFILNENLANDFFKEILDKVTLEVKEDHTVAIMDFK